MKKQKHMDLREASCLIGVRQRSGEVKAIYCRYDGYYDWTGKMLLDIFGTASKINELVDLGDILCISYDFDSIDGYKQSMKPKKCYDDFDFMKYGTRMQVEYLYLFDELTNKWFAAPACPRTEFRSLEQTIRTLGKLKKELNNRAALA